MFWSDCSISSSDCCFGFVHKVAPFIKAYYEAATHVKWFQEVVCVICLLLSSDITCSSHFNTKYTKKEDNFFLNLTEFSSFVFAASTKINWIAI